MAKGDTKTNQYLDIAANGTRSDFPASCCETRSQTLIREVGERIMDLEDEVERLENNPDVADIVATYADLQSYDTSQLTDKDIVRVLQDETHDGDSTYYRWSTSTNTWTYIGESKQYTDFVGTDGTTAGTAGLVPAPATTDAGKFLSASGLWEAVQGGGGGVTELTSADYNYPESNPDRIAAWLLPVGTYTVSEDNVNVGFNANWYVSRSTGYSFTALADEGGASGNHKVIIAPYEGTLYIVGRGNGTAISEKHLGNAITSIVNSLTSTSRTSALSANQGRVLKDLVDPTTDSSAPTTATVGRLGQIFIDTTNADAYMCVAVDSVTPSYTWKQITA